MIESKASTQLARLNTNSTQKENKVLDILGKFVSDKKINENLSINRLIYGFRVYRLKRKNHISLTSIFLDEYNNKCIKYISQTSGKRYLLDLNKITFIEYGAKTGNFTKCSTTFLSNYPEEFCMTIYLNTLTLDFIFLSRNDLMEFNNGVYNIWKFELKCEMKLSPNQIVLKNIWKEFDSNFSGVMEFKEFYAFAKKMKLHLKEKEMQKLFKRLDSDSSGLIDFQEFQKYYDELTSGNELKLYFCDYSDNSDYLNCFQFIKFMKECQNEYFTIEEALTFLLELNKTLSNAEKNRLIEKIKENNSKLNDKNWDFFDKNELEVFQLNYHNFQSFIGHPYNYALSFTEHSLDHPCNDYFIYSSHNTYLSGHQLYGESSVEMYSMVINLGCRCVELDCWDGPNNEPRITHGMTLTSDILFKDVLKVLKEKAFSEIDTPFFLSIEMHCSAEQQKVMAIHFENILKDYWIPEHDMNPSSFPSPNQLKNKFIIKCKKPKVIANKKTNLEVEKIPEFREDLSSSIKNLNFIKKRSILRKHLEFKKEEESPKTIVSQITINDAEIKQRIRETKKKIKEVDPSLYSIIGLCSIELNLKDYESMNNQPWEVVSFTEKKVLKNLHNLEKLRRFTKESFLRVYPLGTRIDSSNYDPIKSWICGAQLVSLNLQSLHDDYTLLNHIFFKDNLEKGYLLKPSFLRKNQSNNCNYDNPVESLSFSLISASMIQRCLKQNSEEIYFTIKILGTPKDDEKNIVYKSEKIKQNFVKSILFTNCEFHIYEPELTFIYIHLFDQNNEVLGKSVIPLKYLKSGVRNIPLYDNSCLEIENTLIFIHSERKIL